MKKTIESFCCHEKSLEYDEYDDILKKVESQKFTCMHNRLVSFSTKHVVKGCTVC